MVESDLVPLDELLYEDEPESDVLGTGAERSVFRHAQCSCAVVVDGDRGGSPSESWKGIPPPLPRS